MASQPLDRYTLEQYLELQESLPYRSEFHDGLILPIDAATPTHGRLGARMGRLLESSLLGCSVYDSSLNLYIASVNKIVHADVTAVCGQPSYPKPNCIDNPTILVEVTSPTTKDYDNGTKREYYFGLPSLQHYLLVSQTEKLVGHHQRSGDGWLYVDRCPGGVLLFDDVEIEIGHIYEGVLA